MAFESYSPSQLFSYYPKYEYLDNVLSATNRKRMNLFIDVKGCGQGLFQEWGVKHILSQSQGSNIVDTSVFSAMLDFVAFHKLYAKKRNIDIYLYFFMESGKSSYHNDVYSEYKSNRKGADFFGLDTATEKYFRDILFKNYKVADRVMNRLDNVSFINLHFLEADFIPWYLMKHVLTHEEVETAANIIYSTDKDMLQCLDDTNVFQYYRHYKKVKMITGKDIYTHFLKGNDLNVTDPSGWFPMVLSIIGDEGDGFSGVKGIGEKTLPKIFDYVVDISGKSIEAVYDNIHNKQPIFKAGLETSNNALKKVLAHEDIIIRNLKLASYKLLSDHVNGGFPTDMIEKKKLITENIQLKERWSGAGILYKALQKAGLHGAVSELTLTNLF